MSLSNSQNAEELKNTGNEHFKKGDFAGAWEFYNKAVAADSTNVIYFANRAQCELKLEQFGSAAETCTQALALDASFVKCYYRRAIAFGGMLQYSKAVRDFQKVVSLAPTFTEGKSRLQAAQALLRYTAFQKAIQADDEPSVFDRIDLESMPLDDGPSTKLDLDLDNLDDDSIQRLVAHFKSGKRLPKRTVYDIVIRVSKIFRNEPTMNEISVVTDPKAMITICGDTHGQFYDLLNIFERNGWPSELHQYLFNGDFVDRGNWSTEVALLLYVLKIRFPEQLWLNRGNHETDSMNATYGFSGECKAKYGIDMIFKAFSESFSMLPLACLVNGIYFVVHGGIFSDPDVTLKDIRNIDRFIFKQPPNSGAVMEMLWADPGHNSGIGPSKRGISHEFGPDITAKFVEKNNLSVVIRSHEVRQHGYQVEHDGKLVTVFSAPNYCDSVGNMGAYINIKMDLKLNYEVFGASWHPKSKPMEYASGMMR